MHYVTSAVDIFKNYFTFIPVQDQKTTLNLVWGTWSHRMKRSAVVVSLIVQYCVCSWRWLDATSSMTVGDPALFPQPLLNVVPTGRFRSHRTIAALLLKRSWRKEQSRAISIGSCRESRTFPLLLRLHLSSEKKGRREKVVQKCSYFHDYKLIYKINMFFSTFQKSELLFFPVMEAWLWFLLKR